MILYSVCTTFSLIPYYHPHDIAFCYNVYNLFRTIHMILHSVCTRSLIPYYHPHGIAFCVYNVFAYSKLPSTRYNAFCLYNVFTYSILPSTWYCILFVQGVHLVHITIHMILHSVCTRSLIPYYHPHDIAFCLYVVTYSILKSTRYCILCVQHVHLFHITHPHDIAFCLYNVSTDSILPSIWYCILFVQRGHLFHIKIHTILHSVCTTCSLTPYLPSTWYCILCVQRVHLFHITIHMIVHSVCTTCSLIPYFHPHDSAFCLYNVFAYSILPSTWYCILFVQHVHLFHITQPHDIAFCSYNVFTYSVLPSTWYCILFVHVHLFHITIHMILHSVCTTCSLIPYYHPHDSAFCLYNVFTSILPSTWSCILLQRFHLFHITIHMILHSVCITCSLIPYYHPHGIAFCVYNVFAYSILPSTRYCILFVQRVHFHITIHMILHSVTTCSLIPYYHPHDIAFCLYKVFT